MYQDVKLYYPGCLVSLHAVQSTVVRCGVQYGACITHR